MSERDSVVQAPTTEPNEIIQAATRDYIAAQLTKTEVPHAATQKAPIDSASRDAADVKTDQLAAKIKEALAKRYIEGDKTFHFRYPRGGDDLAFTHTNSKIATQHNRAEIVRDMVGLAVAKGWAEIKLKGSDDFKREAWLEASLYGLNVDGYKPRHVDITRLEALRAEESRSASSAVVQLRREHRTDEASRSAPSSSQTHSVIGELQHLMRARGDSEVAVGMAVAVATERLERYQHAVVGTLKDHGHAPYQHRSDEKSSYYVTLETRAGQKTVWGVDLERALANSEAKTGQIIALENRRRKSVTVEESIRDADGAVVGSRKMNAHRNEWTAIVLDNVNADVREQLHVIDVRQGLRPSLPEGYQRPRTDHVHRSQQDINRVELDRDAH